ncbi:SpaA isopeptide-forming pilin-related protein [Mycoplasma sp. P36-A1]|uniref:SpaA isopeptide-forming pilin-related protein n=1 Tax=Mycoplasma sp. P36-A1 TaxID=3252900 RepID=UPI003C2EFB2C
MFTLEDEHGDIIKTVTINKQSIGKFTTVPVGTFYLKEQKPATTDYVLSLNPIKIISTKDSLQATTIQVNWSQSKIMIRKLNQSYLRLKTI